MRHIWIFSILLFVISFTTHGQAAHKNNLPALTIHKDISFGKDRKQKLDIYRLNPKGPHKITPNRPVILFVHGGAWRIGDKKQARKHGEFYAENDIIFVAVNYRLSNKATHPAQAQDVAAAIRWVHDNISEYNGNPDDITLIGHSAGAHLVALVVTDPHYLAANDLATDLIKLVVPVDTAAFDLPAAIATTPKPVKKLMHKNFSHRKNNQLLASPVFHVKKGNGPYPPFIIYNSDERPNAVQIARNFTSALKKTGSKAQLIILNRISHRKMNLLISGPNNAIATDILQKINN